MRITVELQDVMSYSLFVLLAGILLAGAAVFIMLKYGRTDRTAGVTDADVSGTPADLKARYLSALQKLENRYLNNQITVRGAYQQLSAYVREYAAEKTGVPADRMTLEDLRRKKVQHLPAKIEKYYAPEFARQAEDRFISSVHEASEVIRRWN